MELVILPTAEVLGLAEGTATFEFKLVGLDYWLKNKQNMQNKQTCKSCQFPTFSRKKKAPISTEASKDARSNTLQRCFSLH